MTLPGDPYAKAVKEQPGHIDQRELARTLGEQWGLAPGRLRHLPVSFGDHHWELTGRPVSGAAMRMYRMRWSLDDIALAVRDFRAPHEQNEDSGLTWEALTEEIGEMA